MTIRSALDRPLIVNVAARGTLSTLCWDHNKSENIWNFPLMFEKEAMEEKKLKVVGWDPIMYAVQKCVGVHILASFSVLPYSHGVSCRARRPP